MPHNPKGNRPRGAIGALRIESDADNLSAGVLRDWRVYKLATSAGDWLNVKLVRARPGSGAANYWLGYNVAARKLARTSEAARMPDALRDAIAAYLDLWQDTGSDAEASELLAELDRRDGVAGA